MSERAAVDLVKELAKVPCEFKARSCDGPPSPRVNPCVYCAARRALEVQASPRELVLEGLGLLFLLRPDDRAGELLDDVADGAEHFADEPQVIGLQVIEDEDLVELVANLVVMEAAAEPSTEAR